MADERAGRRHFPTGTVTFLFTDIEDSTRLAQATDVPTFRTALEQHHSILRAAWAAHGGVERATEGDAFFVVFTDAAAAVAAAVEAQRQLAAAQWPSGVDIRVRMGIHSGAAVAGGDDYVGIDVNRAARIAGSGSGRQVLISDATRALAERDLPAGVSMRDLGEHRFKGLVRPERIFQLLIDGLPADFPPLRSLDVQRGNLPRRLTSFIGREPERFDVAALLDEARLVTITGPGGTGKTSLAQAVAHDVIADCPDGAWFVPLEGVADAVHIPDAIVHALGLDVEDGRPTIERLVTYLVDRRLLLVLDNFEHLGKGASLVHQLLISAAGLRVLVASQVPLHLGGEREYPLGPLSVADVPGTDQDASAGAADRGPNGALDPPAIRLFVERARELEPTFELTAANRVEVAALCARLDGLPLALELAAAQVRFLSPAAILERLDRRLGLMASRRGDIPERQRTLESAVAWSYDLLPEAEQVVLRHLAVFAGGARLSEVEELVAALDGVSDPIASLSELVDRSLVQHRQADDDRFALLETIRTFADARLREHGEEGAAVARHAEIYLAIAETAEPELYRSARRTWLDRLSAEHANLRVAFDRMMAIDKVEIPLRMFAALWRFWQLTGRLEEAHARVDPLLAAAEGSNDDLSPALMSRVYEAAGGIGYWQRVGDIARIRIPYEKSLEYAIASGDPDRIGWATYNLSFGYDYVPAAVDNMRPEPERAKALRDEALRLFRSVGDKRGIAYTLWSMAGSPIALQDEPEVLRDRLVQALGLFREIDEAYGETWALMSLGMVEAVTGRVDAAREAVADAARLFVRDGDLSGQIVVIDAIASLAARGGDPKQAVRIDGAGLAARKATGAASPAIPPLRGPIAAARELLGAEIVAGLEREGRALSFQDILEEAMQEGGGARRAIVEFAAGAAAEDEPRERTASTSAADDRPPQ